MKRRTLLASVGSVAAVASLPKAWASTVGVTETEIKIGNTMPYSGPASAYGAIGRGHTAFFKMVNEKGGINGRKVNFITLDDAYSPPKTVEQVRRLVEQDEVAFVFNPLGTPSNTAIQKYMNQKKVPQLFVSSGADKWGDYKDFPWTIGWQPSYRTEAQIYAKYVLQQNPNSKIAVLYQNDDFGKDYLTGLRDALGANYAKFVVKEASYEVTDATIDSQAIALKDSGADVLVTAATPKFAAQMVRKVFDIGWKPLHCLTNVSISVGSVMQPAGAEKGIGIISADYRKDPTDARWKDDAGMGEWRGFMKQYLPDADLSDNDYVFSYGVCVTLRQVLQQCGSDLSRENIMKQAASLKDFTVPVLLPGIRLNTSATNYHPMRQMQLVKWTGKTWDLFGDLIEGTGA
jgi:branched-chain amino acid transport system substrate-binding protein